HALGVRQMSDRENRDAWLARRSPVERADSEGLALQPGREPGRGDQPVDPEGKFLAILARVELLEIERTDPRHRRRLDLVHELLEIEVLSRAPSGREQSREKNVLAAFDRVGRDADKRQQARRGRRPALEKATGVVAQR